MHLSTLNYYSYYHSWGWLGFDSIMGTRMCLIEFFTLLVVVSVKLQQVSISVRTYLPVSIKHLFSFLNMWLCWAYRLLSYVTDNFKEILFTRNDPTIVHVGFNSTLRRGNITHHEYIQVGKGRDVGLNQISLFEAKVACGNGEQTLSRDIYRLGHRFDFFRMMSFYYTTTGFYVSSMVISLYLTFCTGIRNLISSDALGIWEETCCCFWETYLS